MRHTDDNTCNRDDLRDVEYRGGYYYAMYGHDIVASYRAKYKQKFPGNPLFEKKEPSFVEFVEYLIETPLDKYDEHWKPIFVLCPPCHFNFDIIVKMETFKRDTEFLLNQRGIRIIDSKEINNQSLRCSCQCPSCPCLISKFQRSVIVTK